jgi:hypothetical protein
MKLSNLLTRRKKLRITIVNMGGWFRTLKPVLRVTFRKLLVSKPLLIGSLQLNETMPSSAAPSYYLFGGAR